MNLENLKDMSKLKSLGNQAIRVGIVLISLAIGFVIGEYKVKMNQEETNKLPLELKEVKNLTKTSVAINERGELLIINRSEGEYEIYSDSVGKVIFKLYASQMSSN